MAQIILGPNLSPNLDGSVKKAAYAFLEKLGRDDTAPGLHIEPINNSADPRIRTGRVNDMWRALLVLVQGKNDQRHYVYLGTLPHDKAIARAKTTVIAINPRNGIAELIEADTHTAAPATREAAHDQLAPPTRPEAAAAPAPRRRPLEAQGITHEQLIDLGISPRLADQALRATDDDELLAILSSAPAAWQADALIDLAAGTGIDAVIAKLSLELTPASIEATTRDVAGPHDDDLLHALQQPGSRMDFAFIEDDAALRAAIEDEDFGRWRVFLHPEQREYAYRDRNGAFRLTGGAGTGKTIVLVHRARHLARTDPTARIVLTTYNRTLAASLKDTLRLLDPSLPILDDKDLGRPGIYVASVDAIAYRVLSGVEGAALPAITHVLGERSAHVRGVTAHTAWSVALAGTRDSLPPDLANETFLSAEYATVVVPHRITERDAYLKVRRPGRGVALGRLQRVAIWNVIDAYRAAASAAGRTDFDEKAMIAAVHLNTSAAGGGPRLADHVLVDEAQDLAPSRLHLVRALVAEDKNDLFIAEDSQQRIYGQKVVLSRYGIAVRGRSRRLTLNYRTTAQNLRYAIGILSGTTWTDLDDEDVSPTGYRSARSGPAPQLIGTMSLREAYDALVATVRGWIDEEPAEDAAATIGVLVRTRHLGDSVARILDEHGLPARFVSDDMTPGNGQVLVMTMHRSKGMEFKKVVLFGLSDDEPAWTGASGPVPDGERADTALRTRSLLYVAATRARDELALIWTGEPSTYLPRSGEGTASR